MSRKKERSRYAGLYYRLNTNDERVYTYRVRTDRRDENDKVVYEWVTCPLGTTIEDAHEQQITGSIGAPKISVKTKNDDAFALYYNAAKTNGSLRGESLRNYDSYWRNHISPIIGRKAVEATTHTDLIRVLDLMEARIVSRKGAIKDPKKRNVAASKRMVLKVWNQTFTHITSGSPGAQNPSQWIPRASRPKGSRRRRIVVLTTEQITTLLERCTGLVGDEYRIYYLVSIYCGLRIGELLNLQWKHIDFERGLLHVIGSSERDEDDEWDVKTDAGERDVPISADVLAELRQHLHRTPFRGPEHYVFAKYRGNGEVRNKDTVREQIRRHTHDFVNARGRAQDVRPHVLRHTFFSLLGQRGVDIYTAAQIGGHSSTRITHDYQQWFDPTDRMREVREKLAAHYAELG